MRYAIYFTPSADDALAQCGAHWLGRDAFTGLDLTIVDQQRRALVATPARYGFHATIKAPFNLIDPSQERALKDAFTEFCAVNTAINLPDLNLRYSGNSFVLGLTHSNAKLQQLAADIVRRFDEFRAPLEQRDIDRRKPDQLSNSQRHNLYQWGYPHVMDDFRFHMTLTGPVPEEARASVAAKIEEHFKAFLGKDLTFGGLGLFIEPARGENFHVVDWKALKA